MTCFMSFSSHSSNKIRGIYVILFWILFADEWKNFLARIGRDENTPESELIDNEDDNLELRFWASYRGQTLSRTGTFYLFIYLHILI